MNGVGEGSDEAEEVAAGIGGVEAADIVGRGDALGGGFEVVRGRGEGDGEGLGDGGEDDGVGLGGGVDRRRADRAIGRRRGRVGPRRRGGHGGDGATAGAAE